jgi:hypothetical protein
MTSTSFIGSNNNIFIYMDDETGNVAIGSSNVSSNNKLYVEGSIIIASNIVVNGSLTAINGITVCNSTYQGNSNDTASIPTFSWKQESNMGMYHASNSSIGFSTVATERMIIDNVGRVGIGKTPTSLLDIAGNANFDSNVNINSNLYVLQNQINNNTLSNLGNASFSSNVIINSNLNINNKLFTQNQVNSNTLSNLGNAYFASNVLINSNLFVLANIGIGKSNPLYSMDILGDLNFTGTLRKGGAPYVGSQWSNNSSNVFIFGSNIGLGLSNPSEALEVKGSNVKFGCNLYILSNVGIGKSNPLYPLDILGDLNFTGTLRQGGVPYVGSQWSNNSSNVFIFDSNVGIGISNPLYKLDVNGDGNFSSNLIVNGLSTFNSNVTINGILTVKNAIYTTSNIVIINNNQTIIQSNINIQSNLIVSQSTTLSNGLSNLGNAYFASNLTINGQINLSHISTPSNISISNLTVYYNSNSERLQSINGYNKIRSFVYLDDINNESLSINYSNFRYSELLNTSNQILYSSMCNIQLNNETYMQTDSFTHQQASPSIQLNSTGTHLCFFSLNLNTFNSPSNPSLISMQAVYNSNIISGSLTNIINNDVYNQMSMCFLQTGNSNDTISFQAKINTGNSNVQTVSNMGAIANVIKFSTNVTKYIMNVNTITTELTTTFSDIVINNTIYNVDNTTFDYSNNGLYIKSSGNYMILAKLNFVSSNNASTSIESYLLKNNIEMNGTRFYTSTMDAIYNASGAMTSYINNFASNDFIKVQSHLINTSATSNVWTTVNGCSIIAIQLNSNIDSIQAHYSNLNSVSLSNISNSFGLIPYNIIGYSNSANYTLSNSIIKNSIPSYFLSMGSISFSNNNNSNLNANIVSRFRIDSNVLPNFYKITRSNGIQTQFIHNIIGAQSNNELFLENANIKYNNNLKFMNNACSLSIINLDKPTITKYNQYGNYFKFKDQIGFLQTNNTNFTNIITLTTDYLNNGLYRIGSYYEYIPRSSDQKQIQFRTIVDNNNIIYNKVISTFNEYNKINNNMHFSEILLSSNMHTIRCEVCTFSSNDFVTIQNTRLEIWQVK